MKYFVSKKIKRNKSYLKIIFISLIMFFPSIIILNTFQDRGFLKLIVYNSLGNLKSYNPTYHLFLINSLGFFNNKEIKTVKINEEPLIYIYNTFQTDKYKSNYANTYNVNSLITQASYIFRDYLKKEGINSIVEEESVAKILKDNNTPYDKSYRASRILLEKAKANHSSLTYFLDFQMFYQKRESIIINNLSYAPISFVIGTEYETFLENKKFADTLNNILKSYYEELSLGIEYRGGDGYHGVYNEDFSPFLLLIEIGSKENTIGEVNRSLEVLAKVFKEYLRGDK